MSALLFSVATFISTSLGGLFALRFRDRLHYVLSFAAGVLLGVVAFDLLPEIFAIAATPGIEAGSGMVALLVGFLFFHGMEKLASVHTVHEDDYATHHHPHIGMFSALALAGHSFIDGVGIGLGFQVSEAVGVTVGIAVITHDFCDGLNTVSVMLIHRNTTARALGMLALDAVAPLLGVLSTTLFHVSSGGMMLFLGFFAGFLFYIAASDILPEAHSQNRSAITGRLIALTCLGAALIYGITRLTG